MMKERPAHQCSLRGKVGGFSLTTRLLFWLWGNISSVIPASASVSHLKYLMRALPDHGRGLKWEMLDKRPISEPVHRTGQGMGECSEPSEGPKGTAGRFQEDGTGHNRTGPLAVVQSRAKHQRDSTARLEPPGTIY